MRKQFNDLPEKVREKVVRYLRHCMKEFFGVLASMREYQAVLDQVNPEICFFIEGEQKKFCIVDTNEEVGQALGKSLAIAAKWNPAMMDHLIVKIIKDVDGLPRLKY